MEFYNILRSYIDSNSYEGPYIFSKSKGIKPIANFQIYQHTYKAFKKLGITEESVLNGSKLRYFKKHIKK